MPIEAQAKALTDATEHNLAGIAQKYPAFSRFRHTKHHSVSDAGGGINLSVGASSPNRQKREYSQDHDANSLRADHRRVASDDPAIFLDHSHRWLPAIKLRGVQFTRGITHLLRVQPRVPAELRGALAMVITAGLFGGVSGLR
jgi:hypothetical protein